MIGSRNSYQVTDEMYFIRSKKHKRDQEAGLIFHWRGFRKHHLGKIIALLVASGFFAFSVYAIKIEGLKTPLLSKKEGVVIMLNMDDPNCHALLLQVEERSPFPARWDPVLDREVMLRLGETQSLLEGGLWDYRMSLEAMPEDKSSVGLASIVESYKTWPVRTSRQWPRSQVKAMITPGGLSIKARVIASGDLDARIAGVELALPLDMVADEGFGQVFRFQLALDGSGYVISCIPLPGGTTDVAKITDRQKKLAAWLRAQRFNPAQPETTTGPMTGQLELQIEAIRE